MRADLSEIFSSQLLRGLFCQLLLVVESSSQWEKQAAEKNTITESSTSKHREEMMEIALKMWNNKILHFVSWYCNAFNKSKASELEYKCWIYSPTRQQATQWMPLAIESNFDPLTTKRNHPPWLLAPPQRWIFLLKPLVPGPWIPCLIFFFLCSYIQIRVFRAEILVRSSYGKTVMRRAADY